jgi:ATP-dependent Clp protease ATP-binding subunit ClpC
VFERFTEAARQVVVYAQDEARRLGHNFIGTEHLLLGLLREEGLAARVLDSLDITVEEVRAQVARFVGEGDEVTTGEIPFTPRAKKALSLSLREALRMEDDHIRTEHVLLGLVAVENSVAARILRDFDADAETIGDAVSRELKRPSPRPFATARPGRFEEFSDSALIEVPPSPQSTPLLVAIVLAAAGFPLGLLAGFLIWG